MPQPRSRASSRARNSRRQADDDASVAEQLRRLLSPLDVLLITRDRLQDALDDAVQRGRMTRDDATELLSELMRRSRRQTEELLADLVSAPTDRVRREVDRARRAAGIGAAFPISGYDDLTAAQVVASLDDLDAAALRRVRDYERRNANRKSVLAAVEQRLSR